MKAATVLLCLACVVQSTFAFLRPSTSSSRPVVGLQATLEKPAVEEEAAIEAVRHFITKATGYYTPCDPSLLSEDFVFRGPIIGPFNKEDYLQVLDLFRVYEAFEDDLSPNPFGFSVDPDNPYRVWFQIRASGTMHGESKTGLISKIASSRIKDGEKKKYKGNTETWCMELDEDMKIRYINAGYVVNRFEDGATSEGKGLSFGILKTLGLDIASNPGPSARLVQAISGLFPSTSIPKAYSKENVPSWWTDPRRGGEA